MSSKIPSQPVKGLSKFRTSQNKIPDGGKSRPALSEEKQSDGTSPSQHTNVKQKTNSGRRISRNPEFSRAPNNSNLVAKSPMEEKNKEFPVATSDESSAEEIQEIEETNDERLSLLKTSLAAQYGEDDETFNYLDSCPEKLRNIFFRMIHDTQSAEESRTPNPTSFRKETIRKPAAEKPKPDITPLNADKRQTNDPVFDTTQLQTTSTPSSNNQFISQLPNFIQLRSEPKLKEFDASTMKANEFMKDFEEQMTAFSDDAKLEKLNSLVTIIKKSDDTFKSFKERFIRENTLSAEKIKTRLRLHTYAEFKTLDDFRKFVKKEIVETILNDEGKYNCFANLFSGDMNEINFIVEKKELYPNFNDMI
jgi:hypothetical protein